MSGLWFWEDNGGVRGRWYGLTYAEPFFSHYYGFELKEPA